jgi:hypothetical protein
MATLALTAIGSAVGSTLLPAGLSFLGASISGAVIGQQLGALVGSQIDQALFGGSGNRRAVDGPRLTDLRVTDATEGAAIPRCYGRVRVGAQLIWATSLEEEAVARNSGRGKGTRSAAPAGSDYAYFANFAVALCEGEITAIHRVWADNREIDLSDFTARFYTGTESQLPDPLILAKQNGAAPAYRGLAYIVFEHMPLATFGNRIPQLSFELTRRLDTLEDEIRGVVVIPGSGEFVYAPEPVTRSVGRITTTHENVHSKLGGADWSVSLDQLQTTLPNAKSVSLVVSWFGDDLRAGQCKLEPRIERTDRVTTPIAWSVAGLTRSTARTVSLIDGYPSYGGTPSDQTVVAAIRDLKARGLDVVLSPFILMDVPADNALPDPYSTASSQPAFPWRGRITLSPAAGRPATPDKTTAASAQLAPFIGTATPAHFAIADDTVIYTGPNEWSFRRFILHHAYLCKAAGGVDTFVLGSELRGLTTARSSQSSYPFVAALVQLAVEVRSILGPTTKITYAADWSEYFGHQPADGTADVHFHLDPLWSSSSIDAIGLDVYWPLADWRDGDGHLDRLQGFEQPHDLAYLKHNLTAGEGFDWYYASDAARRTQSRTPIADGAGKPWMFRYKDIKSWWSNPHFNRPGGIESATPTTWVPQSKPFWFLEIGCPAIDKGANQPNLFVDPKSSESLRPHFSTGARDDLMQRRLLQAVVQGFDPTHPDTPAGANPVSSVTGQRMVELARIHVYAWDARPYPAFPGRRDIWKDADNWAVGHWFNGRASAAPMPALVSAILNDYGFAAFDATTLLGTASGLVIDRVMSAREALQPLELAFFFDVVESEGFLRFQSRSTRTPLATISTNELVESRPGDPLLSLTRAQETDLPRAAKVTFISSDDTYAQAVVEAARIGGASSRVASAALGVVLDPGLAGSIADTWLYETWHGRERARFALPPSSLAFEPGDVVNIDSTERRYTVRVTDIGDHGTRDIDAVAFDASIYAGSAPRLRDTITPAAQPAGPPLVTLLDIPQPPGITAHLGSIAVAQSPWPGPVAAYVAPDTSGYTLATLIAQSATTGLARSTLLAGPVGRFDHAATLEIELDSGALASVSDLALFAGANTLAIEITPDVWEILQFTTATLIAPRRYRISRLLRGQRGTDALIATAIPVDARIVVLDAAVVPADMDTASLGLTLNWQCGPARDSLGAPTYTRLAQRFTGQGVRPYAPAHIRAKRTSTGDVALSWVRRTRIDGDSWEQVDVPLGEADERYRVEILAGSVVKRTIVVATTQAVYSAAEQTVDFGTVPPSLTVRVAQLSSTYGAGHTRTLTF